MYFSLPLCGFPLSFSLEGFHGIYALIGVFMWTVSLMFTPRYMKGHAHQGRYFFFTLLTFAATVGVFLSADLYTTFIFFEIMSFASYPWVAQEETPGALRAAQTYLAVAVFGGMVTLMGLFWFFHLAGSLDFEVLRTYAESLDNRSALYWPAALTFVGFAAKAGVFPLHIWLPKAHPVAPAPASALLSGILTKTGVFGMLVISTRLFQSDVVWGNMLLILAGITMVLGAVKAVFSVDLKHTLACSSMSQIGFILTGLAFSVLLGHENALAARGTFLHMLNHSLIKLDLFLCAGAVYMNTHSLDLTRIRGFGRHKPLLHFCFLAGYLGIIGMPLFNGYLSKSLIHEAILEYAGEVPACAVWYSLYEKLFLFSGGLTAAYMSKLYLCLFWFRNRDSGQQEKWDRKTAYLSPVSAVALVLSSLFLPLLGFFPDLTARPLAEASMSFLRGSRHTGTIAWFSLENLQGAGLSLAVGALVCWLIQRVLIRKGEYLNLWPSWLDLEEGIYRPLVTLWLPSLGLYFARLCDRILDNPLTHTWFPRAVTALTRALDRTLENPLFFRWIPRTVSALTRGLDRIIENVLILHWIPEAISFLTAKLSQAADGIVLLLRRTLFRAEKIRDYRLSLSEKADLAVGEAWNRVSPGKDHVAILVSIKKEAEKVSYDLSRSVSLGLLLLVIGLLGTLIYLRLRFR